MTTHKNFLLPTGVRFTVATDYYFHIHGYSLETRHKKDQGALNIEHDAHLFIGLDELNLILENALNWLEAQVIHAPKKEIAKAVQRWRTGGALDD